MDHCIPDRNSGRWTFNMKSRIRSISVRFRSGNEPRVITALFSTVRTEFGPRNLNPPERTKAPRGLRDQADANHVGFFRGKASSGKELRSGRSRLCLSAAVARDTHVRASPATFGRILAKLSLVSPHNPSPGYFVVGLDRASRNVSFRLGKGTEHEQALCRVSPLVVSSPSTRICVPCRCVP